MINERYDVWECFGPLAGIAVGFALGWVIPIVAPDGSATEQLPRLLSTKLFTLVFAILGWALAIVIANGRALFCEAAQLGAEPSRHKYFVLVVLALGILSADLILLMNEMFLWSAFASALLVACILSEMAWGNPVKFIVFLLPSNWTVLR